MLISDGITISSVRPTGPGKGMLNVSVKIAGVFSELLELVKLALLFESMAGCVTCKLITGAKFTMNPAEVFV